jgi:hypothetical protein
VPEAHLSVVRCSLRGTQNACPDALLVGWRSTFLTAQRPLILSVFPGGVPRFSQCLELLGIIALLNDKLVCRDQLGSIKGFWGEGGDRGSLKDKLESLLRVGNQAQMRCLKHWFRQNSRSLAKQLAHTDRESAGFCHPATQW